MSAVKECDVLPDDAVNSSLIAEFETPPELVS